MTKDEFSTIHDINIVKVHDCLSDSLCHSFEDYICLLGQISVFLVTSLNILSRLGTHIYFQLFFHLEKI